MCSRSQEPRFAHVQSNHFSRDLRYDPSICAKSAR
jgi:hypothetical protein